MAESKFSRKYKAYRHLHHINRAFQYLTQNLELMLNMELLQQANIEIWQDRLGEIQAEINKDLTGNLHEQESKETRRLGQVVEAWEESHNPQDKPATKTVRKKPSKSTNRK